MVSENSGVITVCCCRSNSTVACNGNGNRLIERHLFNAATAATDSVYIGHLCSGGGFGCIGGCYQLWSYINGTMQSTGGGCLTTINNEHTAVDKVCVKSGSNGCLFIASAIVVCCCRDGANCPTQLATPPSWTSLIIKRIP